MGRTGGFGKQGNADVFRVLIKAGKVMRQVNLTKSQKWDSGPGWGTTHLSASRQQSPCRSAGQVLTLPVHKDLGLDGHEAEFVLMARVHTFWSLVASHLIA